MLPVKHHGAATGVTGSCHEIQLKGFGSILVDCGLKQGDEAEGEGLLDQAIGFSVEQVAALCVTHCHIDHVGRIPALLAAGFRGPIFCTEATATLLPLVLDDAIKLGLSRDPEVRQGFISLLTHLLQPQPYDRWVDLPQTGRCRFHQAGHILGSAWIEFDVAGQTLVFSGDLGVRNTPLLADPVQPKTADMLIIESTYGDKNHASRIQRHQRLRDIIEHTLQDGGVTLIPAFSMGRTQELVYEFEQILHEYKNHPGWHNLPIIVDSPMASKFTVEYRQFRQLWDSEAQVKLRDGRHPLAFENLVTIDDHNQHQKLVNRFEHGQESAIVIAASGMCTGGRIMNYLRALIEKPGTDILFVGYQASGTPGHDILKYGPDGGWVRLQGQKYNINARVHQISGYSAHADQQELTEFVTRMDPTPAVIRIVHGEPDTQREFARVLKEAGVDAKIQCACDG